MLSLTRGALPRKSSGHIEDAHELRPTESDDVRLTRTSCAEASNHVGEGEGLPAADGSFEAFEMPDAGDVSHEDLLCVACGRARAVPCCDHG